MFKTLCILLVMVACVADSQPRKVDEWPTKKNQMHNHDEQVSFLNEGHTTVENTVSKRVHASKFEAMCKSYLSGTRQFAVVWVGDDDYSVASKNNPFDFKDKDGLIRRGDYYMAARVSLKSDTVDGISPPTNFNNRDKHSECLIVDNIDPVLTKYKSDKSDNKPKLYLFTYNSPCGKSKKPNANGCSGKLNEWMEKNKDDITKLTVAWDVLYIPRTREYERLFLETLTNLLSNPQIEFEYQEESYCGGDAKKWFQKRLYKCIKEKNTGNEKYGCSTVDELNTDLMKFINSATWSCATRDESQYKVTLPKSKPGKSVLKDIKCWEPRIKSAITTDTKADELKTAVTKCFESVLGDKAQIGPMLDTSKPNDITVSILKKDLGVVADQLCFTK